MIVAIEPHADDAFLSLGGLLEGWIKMGQKVTIVTVYSGTRKRAADAEAYAKAIGAEWRGMGAVEYGSMKEGDPAGIITPQNFEGMRDILDPEKVRTFLLPLAIGGHPEHVEVKAVFSNVKGVRERAAYYADQPYAAKLKAQEEVDDTLTGRTIFAIHRPGARKYRHVKLFKDQSFFFHLNPPEDLMWKTFELVVY
jgi:LmbE family N-acetylglucosaminyl deacetylase